MVGPMVAMKKERDWVVRSVQAQLQGGETKGPATSMEFYAVGRLLGKGAFGKVMVGVHKLTHELAAVKICERRRMAEAQAKKCLTQEMSVLKRLTGHYNVIQLFEVIETNAQVVLVMEFAPGGDLLKYVRQRRKLTEKVAQDLFKQLMDGIQHIHSMGVIHRDIKLENLLLDLFGCLKIADFGVAVVHTPGKRLFEHCGTPSYIAPEILLDAGYLGPPVDVWSAGVSLYAMLLGRAPFKGDNFPDLKRAILRGKFALSPQLSPAATSLVEGLLVLEPNDRATVAAALQHAWLDGVRNRGEEIYGKFMLPRNQKGPEGSVELAADPATRAIAARVAECGFPMSFLEDSLQEGRFNHACATYHLLAQQAIRKLAAAANSVVGRSPLGEADHVVDEVLVDLEESPLPPQR